MYDAPLAPTGMGQEFINAERKPLSEYVGASVEFGDEPWDPWSLSELWKVSANNPDVAWLREAELKHGRLSMLAFAGILATNGGVHLPGSSGPTRIGLLHSAQALQRIPRACCRLWLPSASSRAPRRRVFSIFGSGIR